MPYVADNLYVRKFINLDHMAYRFGYDKVTYRPITTVCKLTEVDDVDVCVVVSFNLIMSQENWLKNRKHEGKVHHRDYLLRGFIANDLTSSTRRSGVHVNDRGSAVGDILVNFFKSCKKVRIGYKAYPINATNDREPCFYSREVEWESDIDEFSFQQLAFKELISKMSDSY